MKELKTRKLVDKFDYLRVRVKSRPLVMVGDLFGWTLVHTRYLEI
jgi:hypothetical protein